MTLNNNVFHGARFTAAWGLGTAALDAVEINIFGHADQI